MNLNSKPLFFIFLILTLVLCSNSANATSTYNATTNIITCDTDATIASIYSDVSNTSVLYQDGSEYWLNATIDAPTTAGNNFDLNLSYSIIHIAEGQTIYARGRLYAVETTIDNQVLNGVPWELWGYANRYAQMYDDVSYSNFEGGYFYIARQDNTVVLDSSIVENCSFSNMTNPVGVNQAAITAYELYNSTFDNVSSSYVNQAGVSAQITNNLTFSNIPDVNWGALFLGTDTEHHNITVNSDVWIGGKETYNISLYDINSIGTWYIYRSSGYGTADSYIIDSDVKTIEWNTNSWMNIYWFNGSTSGTGTVLNPLTSSIAYLANVNLSSSSTPYSTGKVREYSLVDILVTDTEGTPVENATVTLSANQSTMAANTLISKDWTINSVATTLSNGHIPLPGEDESESIMALYKEYDSGTSQYYSYNVSVSATGYTNNSTVIIYPDSTWYRSDADEYQNTTVIVLEQFEISSFTPTDNTTSSVNGTEQEFTINTNLESNVTWYIDSVEVQTNVSVTSASYTNSTAIVGEYVILASAYDGSTYANQSWTWTVTEVPATPTTVSGWYNQNSATEYILLFGAFSSAVMLLIISMFLPSTATRIKNVLQTKEAIILGFTVVIVFMIAYAMSAIIDNIL